MAKWRAYTDYDPIRIIHSDSDEKAAKVGLTGNFEVVDESDVPSDRTDRGEWMVENGKVKPDPVKVQAKKDKEQAEKDKKNSIKNKLKALGLTQEEVDELVGSS